MGNKNKVITEIKTKMNQLILGDNLEILKSLSSESIDLIYLDPPFFSNRNYEVIWGDKGEIRSFEDRWAGGIDHYISWLKERVEEMHRILKSTGSIYLHCDHHANAYIRVEILDKIFGNDNFRNEIIWKRSNTHGKTTRKFIVITDTIWFYSKSKNCVYNSIYVEYSENYIKSAYNKKDKKGRYKSDDIKGPGVNPNDLEWKGYHPNRVGGHWGINQEAVAKLVGKEKAKKMNSIEKLDLLYENGLIRFTKNGKPEFKRYLDISKGVLVGNHWADISRLSTHSKERIGYPTQKPEKLIERIIKASSNENDVVMDPFLGGGTTVAVADKLNRQWIGIDQSVQAIKISEMRLQKHRSLFSLPFSLQLHKYDYDDLRNKSPFEFEKWIIGQFEGKSNIKQRSDMGIDGKKENVPIQVKQSESVGRNVVDNFLSAIRRFDMKLFAKAKEQRITAGYLIGFSFGKGAIQEVARLRNKEHIYIKLMEVGDIVPLSRKPRVKVTFKDLGLTVKSLREIEFKAEGESINGIEFYAWDWNYTEKAGFKASVYRDAEGIQKHSFSSGSHSVGIKCVDEAGLECLEIVNLRINGVMGE